MRNVLSAEWTKLLPHKGTWMLVWIYPIFLLAILLIGLFVRLANGDPGHPMRATGWIDQTAAIWNTPQMGFGCYLIAGYFAIVFAGEYGWNTWKLVIPHAARWKLIAAKYVVTLGLLYCAWLIAAAIAVAIELVKVPVLGAALPPGLTFGAVVQGHWATLVLGIAPLLVTAAYASAAAVLTRSTLAALIVSIVMITIDEVFDKLILVFAAWGMGWMTWLYRILPGYHLDNLRSWQHDDVGFVIRLPAETIAYSQTMSLLVLAAWVGGLMALVFFTFRRQDIN